MPLCPEVYEPPPLWLPVASNLVLLLTVPASIYTSYLVIAVTLPHTDIHYKMYLLSYHVFASLFSIVACLTAMVQYMPAFIFIEMGILRLHGPETLLINLMLEVLVQVLCLLVLLYRFMLVIYGIGKRGRIQIWLFITSVCYILPQAIFLISVFKADTPGDDKNDLIRDCPQMKQLTDSYDPIYITVTDFLDMFSTIYILMLAVSMICFAAVLLFCFFKFRERGQFLTEATKKLQTRVLYKLTITLSIPLLSHALPTMVASVIFSLKLQTPLWLCNSLWFLGSLHGMMNCIVFISLNEYYFNQTKKDLRRMTAFLTTALPGKRITSETPTLVL